MNPQEQLDALLGTKPGSYPARSIWMCTTRRCNLSCTYCYQGSHAIVPQGLSHFMSTDVANKAMNWSHEWAKGPLQIIWYGGEPLLGYKGIMKDLVPAWNFARKSMGLPAANHSVTTNGTLLTQEVREWMDEVKMGMLLSLDGPQRFHDTSRPYYDKHSSWNDIKPEGVLKWRPNTEIAWQLDPKHFDPASGAEQLTPDALDEMMAMGFINIAFNVNWMAEWNDAARWNLQWFFKHVTIKMIERQRAVDAGLPGANRIGLGCNWYGKMIRALTVDSKMSAPCGTGLNMVGISPEGWLYPSQEMVYTVTMPDRHPDSLLYYRLGDLNKKPVIDIPRLLVLADIKTSQMKVPAPFNCETCVAKSASIGGCHCRYVGDHQGGGQDVANRFDVTLGYCQSTVAVHTGMLMGASVARFIKPEGPAVPFTGSMQQRSGEAKTAPPKAPCAHPEPTHQTGPAIGAPSSLADLTRSLNSALSRLSKLESQQAVDATYEVK